MKLITLKKFLITFTIFSIISTNIFASNNAATSLTNTNTNVVPLSTFNKRTTTQEWGNNNIFWLDRHDVKCGAQEALQGFKLYRPSTNSLSYKYVCKAKNPSILAKTYTYQTKENSTAFWKSKSANYLDRHDVKCVNNYALQSFKLVRNGNNIQYKFRCVKVECQSRKSFETRKSSDGGYETVYLDRQDVRVKVNEVLVGFKLISKGGRFSYLVTYCELKPPVDNTPKPVIKPVIKLPIGVINPAVVGPVMTTAGDQRKVNPMLDPRDMLAPVLAPVPKLVIAPVQPIIVPKPIVQPVETPQEKGMKFCAENCQDNVSGKLNNCRLYKQKTTFKCRRCSIATGLIITSPAFGKSQDSPAIKSVCETFCSAPDLENGFGKTNGQCVFYGFLNLIKKNNFDINILNKFGLKIRRK